jgi:methylase of polypeptide subunit release factors
VSDQSPCTGLLYGEQPNLSLLQFAGALRGRILDLGCGAGAWAELLRNVGGRELIGVDISAEACDAARSVAGKPRMHESNWAHLRVTGSLATKHPTN